MGYCLIGKKLGHSFSKEIHNLCGLDYELVELEEDTVSGFITNNVYDGLNVTIPYKRTVMDSLDYIDGLAIDANAVNTIVKRNGELIGYNTDVFGIEHAFSKMGVSLKDKNVLILGSGGAASSAISACKNQGAKTVKIVSRTGEINYQNVYQEIETQIIINCTPVGMYPNSFDRPIDLSRFNNLEAVFDSVYNPLKTRLILQAEEIGVKCGGGLIMLISQALKAQELWGVGKFTAKKVDKILGKIQRDRANVVLIGMPSSGKSTIAKALAKELKRELVDTDKLIEQRSDLTIPEIFENKGEAEFRRIESEIIKEVSQRNGLVISTGGGSILSKENRDNLKSNGRIYYIDRAVEKLSSFGRPLSQTVGVKEIYNQRKDIYNCFADFKIDNNGDVKNAIKECIKYESIDN